MLRIASVVLAFALCGEAAAQSVYKCNIDGKITYGEAPCVAGVTTELAVPPAPPPAEPDAGTQLQRQKALAAKLEKERHTREAQDDREQARADAAATTRRKKCDKLRLHKKWADEDAFRAIGPAANILRLKALRQAEELAIECPD